MLNKNLIVLIKFTTLSIILQGKFNRGGGKKDDLRLLNFVLWSCESMLGV